jgi:hypothetical protein
MALVLYTTERDDTYREINKEVLKALFKIEDLDERKKQFIQRSTPTVSTGSYDYILVLDGDNDKESWEELEEVL